MWKYYLNSDRVASKSCIYICTKSLLLQKENYFALKLSAFKGEKTTKKQCTHAMQNYVRVELLEVRIVQLLKLSAQHFKFSDN